MVPSANAHILISSNWVLPLKELKCSTVHFAGSSLTQGSRLRDDRFLLLEAETEEGKYLRVAVQKESGVL